MTSTNGQDPAVAPAEPAEAAETEQAAAASDATATADSTPAQPMTLTSLSSLLGGIESGSACAADGTCD